MTDYLGMLLAACTAGGLFLLYRFLRNRKVFLLFCLTLALAGGIAFLGFRKAPEPTISEAQKYAILEQQQIFVAWYNVYKKNIGQLDHNWQQYHHILENFKEDNISIQTAYVRLTQLESQSLLLMQQMEQHVPPLELENTNYDLVTAIVNKTNAYAHAQHQAIVKSREAADPAQLLSDDQEEQSRRLQEIMIRESPPALFTADEISLLKDRLTIPEESQ